MSPPDPVVPETALTLEELCALTQVSKRTVRYYIQIELLDGPVGETRAARYGDGHIRRLLQIKQLSGAGFSLERIRERLKAAIRSDVYTRRPGTVEQWTTLVIDDGLELSLNPDRVALSAAQVRAIFREVASLYARIKQGAATGGDEARDDGREDDAA